MAPHLKRAQRAYKDIRICVHARTHTHTLSLSLSHTHSLQIHALLVMGWYTEKKNDRSIYAEEKRWVFSFDLKEETEDDCLRQRHTQNVSLLGRCTANCFEQFQLKVDFFCLLCLSDMSP